MFFIETETTIGYGRRSITDQCPEAILLLVMQCLMGTLIDAIMVGCIFIKLSKPNNRTDTLIFSDSAVIAQVCYAIFIEPGMNVEILVINSNLVRNQKFRQNRI